MYTEDITVGNPYRKEYLDGIHAFIKNMQTDAESKREEYSGKIIAQPEKYRKEFCKMLGWPLYGEEKVEPANVKKIFVARDGDISIYRLVISILKIPFYGILFVREDGIPRPLVIAQHGGLGSPELCSDMLAGGSENYNGMVRRMLSHDVNVFAPQLLLWKKEFSDEEYEDKGVSYTDSIRRTADNDLKQLGSSITAIEIYGIMRIIDYFEVQDYVLKDKIGFAGLSYGGFYALFAAACDKRIKCSLSCSFFNDRIKYNWSDWTWFNSAYSFCDAQAALLIYPRKLFIGIGDSDELFDVKSGIKEFEKLATYTKNKDWVYFEHFDGTHEFFKDDSVLDSFIQALHNERNNC